MNRMQLLIIIMYLLYSGAIASEDSLVIFVHPESAINKITKSQIINIYMGKYDEFPKGHKVRPLESAPFKSTFYRQLIKKSVPQVNAYWSRIKFTGRAENRPEVLSNQEQVLVRISKDKNAIGFLPRNNIQGNYKILYEFN